MTDLALQDALTAQAEKEDIRRAKVELYYQAEQTSGQWEYDTYWSGIQADEECQQYVDYTRGCQEYEMRMDAEAEDYAEYLEEQAYYDEQEAAFYQWEAHYLCGQPQHY